jgi:predicted metal-dependent hydrolase
VNQIQLGTKIFTYTRKSLPRSRSLRLRIISPHELLVTCPRLTPQFLIEHFIKNHQRWILNNAHKVKTDSHLSSLKLIYILGKSYQFLIVPSSRNKLTIDTDNFIVTAFTSNISQSSLKTLFDQAFRSFSKKLIEKEIINLSKQFVFSYKKISIRNQKSRFGSCSSSGALSFNWQIVLFPYEKFRHVICHEIAHLTHHNHSKSFWNLVAQYDPNWKANNRWLRTDAFKFFLVPA